MRNGYIKTTALSVFVELTAGRYQTEPLKLKAISEAHVVHERMN